MGRKTKRDIVSKNHGALTVNKAKKKPSPYDVNDPNMMGSANVPPWSLYCEVCQHIEVPEASKKIPTHCSECGWKLRKDDRKLKPKTTSVELGGNGMPIKKTYSDGTVEDLRPAEENKELEDYVNNLLDEELDLEGLNATT